MTENVVYGLHLPGEEYRYIGVTCCLPRARMSEHRYRARDFSCSLPVYNWMRKHSNVMMTIIGSYETYEQALMMERYWIEAAGGKENLLNCTDGGEGSKGHIPSNEIRLKNSGENCTASKLTWPIVRNIRSEYRPPRITLTQLAKKYGVSQTCVHDIVHNQTWREVSNG